MFCLIFKIKLSKITISSAQYSLPQHNMIKLLIFTYSQENRLIERKKIQKICHGYITLNSMAKSDLFKNLIMKNNTSIISDYKKSQLNFQKFIKQKQFSKIKTIQNLYNKSQQNIKNQNTSYRFNNLINIIASTDLLWLAYNNIKSNKGSTIFFTGEKEAEADEITLKKLHKLAMLIKTEKIQFNNNFDYLNSKTRKNYPKTIRNS